jgi:hypothetical protein
VSMPHGFVSRGRVRTRGTGEIPEVDARYGRNDGKTDRREQQRGPNSDFSMNSWNCEGLG